MPNTHERIEQLLRERFSPQALTIEDESWKHAGHAGAREHGGGHYVVHITDRTLYDMPRSRSHRMIYQALASLFPQKIHALSIQIHAPE